MRQVDQGFSKVLVGQSRLQELVLTTIPRSQDASLLGGGLQLLEVGHILTQDVLSILLHDDFQALLIINDLSLATCVSC
jgi:hypothetical protein